MHHDGNSAESSNQTTDTPDVAGTAALAICESLLLTLNDRKFLLERDIIGLLGDAAGAHANAPPGGADDAVHRAAADLINQIIDGGNSVRRRQD